MKFSIQFLIPLLYAISAANAFVAPGARPFAIQQRQGLFAEKNDYLETLSSGVTATEEKAPEKAAEKVEEEEEEELSETQKLMKQVKEAGTAGVISYALWELGFWALSVPVCAVGYYQVTGHWPDLSDPEDQKKLGAEAFAFVNFARFAVPLRIGLALGTTPWIDENIVKRFLKKDDEAE